MKNNDFIKVRLNQFWASYIANGVEDSLLKGEKEIIENTLKIIGVKREHCCDVLEDVHYESPFYPDNEYSDYVTYVFYQL
tara:strand:+ start:77 stop:316 length:240 start_codon:yes stop_codon:yes gene_type:complete